MTSDNEHSIARKTVGGSIYSIAASGVTLTLGFLRAVLMARLLLPSHFGVTTLALFYVNLAAQLRAVGIDSALIHRRQADDESLATYFSMRLGQIAVSVLFMLALLPFLDKLHPDLPALPTIMLAYIGISILKGFNGVQTTILSKRMAFRHLAITDVLSSVTMTVVGPTFAWFGFGAWSIVAELGSGMISRAIGIWLLYRPWRPRLGWNRSIAKWFWEYGRSLWVSSNVTFLLDRFDDWWIGTFLGSNPLGFYSRAYEFAGYPRRAIANPVLSVFFPAFAELQDNRSRLSRAFFRPTSLMVRAGGLFSVIFVSIAPEFIRIFLGERWIPMQTTFQLMIVYTLLDPLLVAATNLLVATGFPGLVARARVLQALIFVPAVLVLGTQIGIEGVALAADLMVLVGAIILFKNTRQVVDYSSRALWLWPFIGVAVAMLLVLLLAPFWASLSVWGALLAKLLLVTMVYLGTLWIAERRQLLSGWGMIWGLVRAVLRLT